ncbi:MAG: SUMF1/EgtB/PvdO family nonheme iron enzyme [Alphaproteobacteria bacterium]|nr:SUMF1/EgtB/PvdO family nonheme iron enzyme [Alphaproteobacteria bacterium]
MPRLLEAIGGGVNHRETRWLQVADAKSNAADRLFLKAIKLYRAGDLEGAAEHFEMGLTINPENPVAHFYFAETLSDMKRDKDAIAHYRKAATLAPGSEEGIIAGLKLKNLAKKSAPGRVFKDCDDCPEMVIVPAGSFMMGSTEPERAWAVRNINTRILGKGLEEYQKRDFDEHEEPQHKVMLRYSFTVGRYEISVGQWRACVSDGACKKLPDGIGFTFDSASPDLAVDSVKWQTAKTYTNWLSKRTGRRYRLLSEAEWEYVARAGTSTAFNVGADINTDQANFSDSQVSYNRRSKTVGQFKANAFGVFDVHGNVAEWVEDCWHSSYEGAPTDGSAWTTGDMCDQKVIRGGSKINGQGKIRSAARGLGFVNSQVGGSGFRVARDLD